MKRKTLLISILLVLLLLAGCSNDGGSGQADTSTSEAEQSDEQSGDDGQLGQSGDESNLPTEPLGFDTDVYVVPPPTDLDEGVAPFRDANEMIDAGVAAGMWTELEGVRAVISVVMGELAPERLPALDELSHQYHSAVLDRAEALIADPSLDGPQMDDLKRLTAFFFGPAPDFSGKQAVARSGGTDGSERFSAVLASSRKPMIDLRCGIDEFMVYGAERTALCYEAYVSDAGDTVLVAEDEEGYDIALRIFAVLDLARAQYPGLAASELPEVSVLVSTRVSLGTEEGKPTKDLALVIGGSITPCRMAIFASESLLLGSDQLRFTVAHEAFHCIQNTWGGTIPDKLTDEGGADYFASKIVDGCIPTQEELGKDLDRRTTTESLLALSYDGWFFWAFLDDQKHLTPLEIASLHRAASEGTAIATGLEGLISDLPKVMNEFYVRLMGPGLACEFVGQEVTDTIEVEKAAKLELKSSLWQGTRYKVNYAKSTLFTQVDGGPGSIGMSKFSERETAGSWVQTAPEVRSSCKDKEPWIVVVTAPPGSSSGTQLLDVIDDEAGNCDACVLGSWKLDLETMSEVYQKIALEGGQGIEITMSGSWVLGFSEDGAGGGKFVSARELGMYMETDVGGANLQIVGSGEGPYDADGELWGLSGYVDTTKAGFGGVQSPWTSSTGSLEMHYGCNEDDMTFIMQGVAINATREPPSPKGKPYF